MIIIVKSEYEQPIWLMHAMSVHSQQKALSSFDLPPTLLLSTDMDRVLDPKDIEKWVKTVPILHILK